MAFVPELDDEQKDSSTDTASDINSQANDTNIQTPTAAPAAGGGQSVGNGATAAAKGPSSSGSFQDFSKFKAANTSKLSALSNLATDQANTNVNSSKSAFDNAGAAFGADLASNKKNYDTSGFANLDTNSTIDATALGNDLTAASKNVDAGAYQGQLAGSQQYTDLQNTENQVGSLNTKAGTASVLGDYGNSAAAGGNYSSSAANQDALLLRSENDYRQKANQIAQANTGLTAKELATQQANLGTTAADVNTNNAAYKQKALEKLASVRSGIDTDLNNKATAAEAERMNGVNSTYAEQAKATAAAIRNNLMKQSNEALIAYGNNPFDKAASDKLTAINNQLGTLSSQSDEDVVNGTDNAATQALKRYRAESSASGITADSILAQDSGKQAQLAALQQLMATGGTADTGRIYNASAMAPVASTALSPLQALLTKLNDPTLSAQAQAQKTAQDTANANINKYQPTAASQAAAAAEAERIRLAQANATKTSGSTKGNVATIANPDDLR